MIVFGVKAGVLRVAAGNRYMVEQAARLAGLPEPMTVTITRDEWPPQHEGRRVMLVLGQRVVSVLLPPGELSVERLTLTLRLIGYHDDLQEAFSCGPALIMTKRPSSETS